MAQAAQAAIIVGPAGSGILTFDSVPSVADFSYKSLPGAAGAPNNATTLNNFVEGSTNAYTTITTVLRSDGTVTPGDTRSAAATWNSANHYLQTRPTGNAVTLMMATLTNNMGVASTNLTISYDLGAEVASGSSIVEEIPGHLVYYSLTGAAGSWVQIPGISGDGTAGPKLFSVDLQATPWPANTHLFVLWADDNAAASATAPSMEGLYTIDNISFTGQAVPLSAPSFVNSTDPTNRSVLQCKSTTLSAAAFGNPAPTYQWFKNDLAHPILGATTTSYNIASMQSTDAGNYFLQALNTSGTAYSHTSTVTYVAVPLAVVKALGGTNQQNILISFTQPIDPTSLDGTANFQFSVTRRGSGDPANVNSSAVVNGTNILLVTDVRPTGFGNDYDVTIDLSEPVTDTCAGQQFSGTFQLWSAQFLLDIDSTQQWRYNDTGVDPGPTWMNTDYNDSGWLQGLALFDGKKVSPQRTDITNIPVRTELVLTNIAAYNFTNDIPTYNFRTHISVSAIPQEVQAVTVWDDGGALFINGTVRLRNRNDATNVFAVYSNAGAVTGEGWFEGPFAIPTASFAVGDNTIAIEMKQVNATSSDLTMGLQLIGYYATLPAALPKITYTYTGDNLQLSFTSGTLYQSIRLGGPPSDWTPVGIGSPVTVHPAAAGGKKFYRLQ